MTAPARLMDLGRLDYAAAWHLQQRLVEDRIAGRRPDSLLLLEHDPVYTVGRSGREAHWADLLRTGPASGGTAIPLHHVERGGSITYHGPGQVVAYPIVRLGRVCTGPKAFVRLLEDVVIGTLAGWGLAGSRVDGLPGVWIVDGPAASPEKIAAVGLRIIKGVTMHGVAVNAAVDLAPFGRITPCGIAGCRVTSMEARLGQPVDLATVKQAIADRFAEAFDLRWLDGAGAPEGDGPPVLEEAGQEVGT